MFHVQHICDPPTPWFECKNNSPVLHKIKAILFARIYLPKEKFPHPTGEIQSGLLPNRLNPNSPERMTIQKSHGIIWQINLFLMLIILMKKHQPKHTSDTIYLPSSYKRATYPASQCNPVRAIKLNDITLKIRQTKVSSYLSLLQHVAYFLASLPTKDRKILCCLNATLKPEESRSTTINLTCFPQQRFERTYHLRNHRAKRLKYHQFRVKPRLQHTLNHSELTPNHNHRTPVTPEDESPMTSRFASNLCSTRENRIHGP